MITKEQIEEAFKKLGVQQAAKTGDPERWSASTLATDLAAELNADSAKGWISSPFVRTISQVDIVTIGERDVVVQCGSDIRLMNKNDVCQTKMEALGKSLSSEMAIMATAASRIKDITAMMQEET